MSQEIAITFRVTGRVQGVGFRAFTAGLARQLDLCGWVKNQPDGSVIGFVQGDRGMVLEFLKQLRIGNRWSSVEGLSEAAAERIESLIAFEIRY